MDTEIVVEKEENALDLAGVGPRLISFIIDGFILFAITTAILLIYEIGTKSVGGANESMSSFMELLVSFAYYTYFFGNGQTPGMMVTRIKVIGTDGTDPLGYDKGGLRWIGMGISGLVLFLGYIWILTDKRRQGWHDKIAGTYVVKA